MLADGSTSMVPAPEHSPGVKSAANASAENLAQPEEVQIKYDKDEKFPEEKQEEERSLSDDGADALPSKRIRDPSTGEVTYDQTFKRRRRLDSENEDTKEEKTEEVSTKNSDTGKNGERKNMEMADFSISSSEDEAIAGMDYADVSISSDDDDDDDDDDDNSYVPLRIQQKKVPAKKSSKTIVPASAAKKAFNQQNKESSYGDPNLSLNGNRHSNSTSNSTLRIMHNQSTTEIQALHSDMAQPSQAGSANNRSTAISSPLPGPGGPMSTPMQASHLGTQVKNTNSSLPSKTGGPNAQSSVVSSQTTTGTQAPQSNIVTLSNNADVKKSSGTSTSKQRAETIRAHRDNPTNDHTSLPSKKHATATSSELPPFFPHLALSFLESNGVQDVGDLFQIDSDQLVKMLLRSDGYKLGCALTAWHFGKTISSSIIQKLAMGTVEGWKKELSKRILNNGPQGLGVNEGLGQSVSLGRKLPRSVSLESFLSKSDTTFLKNLFQITTADHLLKANKNNLVQKLKATLLQKSQNVTEDFCEGIVHSWIAKVNDAVEAEDDETFAPDFVNEKKGTDQWQQERSLPPQSIGEDRFNSLSVTRKIDPMSDIHAANIPAIGTHAGIDSSENSSSAPTPSWSPLDDHKDPTRPLHQSCDNTQKDAYLQVISMDDVIANVEFYRRQAKGMHSPLAYEHIKFLRSHMIHTDEHLARIDIHIFATFFESFLANDESEKEVEEDVENPVAVVSRWRDTARWLLYAKGHLPAKSSLFPPSIWPFHGTSHKWNGDPPLMDNVRDLCHTSPHPATGLPRREISTYDYKNDVLYQFVVEVRNSSIEGAGLGAFITYKGAKVLKSNRKQDTSIEQSYPLTREVLDAAMPGSGNGFSVSITGANIHGDEHMMGPSNGIGILKQYNIDEDFTVPDYNIAFFSRDDGCGLVELGRYAPVLACDRKTVLEFAVKNFLFSFEPMAWRFDVPEELDGYDQVVDFTSDITGDPHEEARRNIAMYVNEVGHNKDLCETVVSRDDNRTVLYYLLLNKPMQKGETLELLVDYKEEYEEIRERKGYGKANLVGGKKCDNDDFARLQRNFKERAEIEKFIRSYTSRDATKVLRFLNKRVLDGLIAATSPSVVERSKEGSRNELEVILRQLVARRRLHWMCARLKLQLEDLSEKNKRDSEDIDRSNQPFRVGMLVYVNNWEPPNDRRPMFSGLAIIDSISLSLGGHRLCDLSLERNKALMKVPEEVLTHPTKKEIEKASDRFLKTWEKWREAAEWPETLKEMREVMKRMEWDSSLDSMIISDMNSQKDEKGSRVFEAVHHEIAEEILFVLSQQKRISRPFNESEWCPLSRALLKIVVRHLAVFVLSRSRNLESKDGFAKKLVKSALQASQVVRRLAIGTNGPSNSSSSATNFEEIMSLVLRKSESFPESHIMTIGSLGEPVPRRPSCLQQYGAKLNVDWYITNQVIAVVHHAASVVDWNASAESSTPIPNSAISPAYSLAKVCAAVGVQVSESELMSKITT